MHSNANLQLLACLFLSACSTVTYPQQLDTDEQIELRDAGPTGYHYQPIEETNDLPDINPLSQDEALAIALTVGVDPDDVVYINLLPVNVEVTEDGSTAELAWGVIEEVDYNDFRVTTINQWSGLVYQQRELPDDNVLDFIAAADLQGSGSVAFGSSAGSYNSFPWDWRLPMDSASFYNTCGYGCGYHTGTDYYATDWADGTSGKLLESPASCWVTAAGWNSGGYGYQVLAECGDAGSAGRYGFRVAHMINTPLVTAGTWIGKGRNLGYIGNTGYSSGAHVHYVVYRGSISGSSVSGSSLPISRWPSSSDSICSSGLTGYSFSGTPYHYLTVTTNGCP